MGVGLSWCADGAANLSGFAAGALLAVAGASQASAATIVLPPVSLQSAPCAAPAAFFHSGAMAPAGGSKTAALLGGAPSALDAIRAQQTSLTPVPQVQGPVLATSGTARFDLAPATGGAAGPTPTCAHFVPQTAAVTVDFGSRAPLSAIAEDPENFLASRRVRIGRTNFDSDWNRVRSERLSRSTLNRYLGKSGGKLGTGAGNARPELLERVNSRVNRLVAYTEDQAQYGKADYWAGARRTLKSGRGDCEDIALAKMQLLAAAGVPAEDMFLTVARDLVRNADHAVLIVRNGGRYAMLDNATDTVLDATPGHDYRPILSFGQAQTWLHGI